MVDSDACAQRRALQRPTPNAHVRTLIKKVVGGNARDHLFAPPGKRNQWWIQTHAPNAGPCNGARKDFNQESCRRKPGTYSAVGFSSQTFLKRSLLRVRAAEVKVIVRHHSRTSFLLHHQVEDSTRHRSDTTIVVEIQFVQAQTDPP